MATNESTLDLFKRICRNLGAYHDNDDDVINCFLSDAIELWPNERMFGEKYPYAICYCAAHLMLEAGPSTPVGVLSPAEMIEATGASSGGLKSIRTGDLAISFGMVDLSKYSASELPYTTTKFGLFFIGILRQCAAGKRSGVARQPTGDYLSVYGTE